MKAVKNGNKAVTVACSVILILLGLLIFILAGFRDTVSQARADVLVVQKEASDHEARLRVLEDNMSTIKQDLREIKAAVQRK